MRRSSTWFRLWTARASESRFSPVKSLLGAQEVVQRVGAALDGAQCLVQVALRAVEEGSRIADQSTGSEKQRVGPVDESRCLVEQVAHGVVRSTWNGSAIRYGRVAGWAEQDFELHIVESGNAGDHGRRAFRNGDAIVDLKGYLHPGSLRVELHAFDTAHIDAIDGNRVAGRKAIRIGQVGL